MTVLGAYDSQDDTTHRQAHPRRHRAGHIADPASQGRADHKRSLHRLTRRLEIEKSAVAFEVFHVTAVGKGHLSDQVHEPLNASKDGFWRMMGEQASRACDIDEEYGQADPLRKAAFTRR
jgi:hypothetical protein